MKDVDSGTPFGFRALILALGLALLTSSELVLSQTAAPAPRPTSPRPLVAAPAKSPQVADDGSVVFHLAMPGAKEVLLSLEGFPKPFPMTKDATGLWSYTVSHLDPEYYSYTYQVDGTDVVDPHDTTVKTSAFRVESVFLVPGHPAKPWEPADVPHGTVHHHLYYSEIAHTPSEYYVYTPPGLDPKAAQKYPVLFLLHGYSDDASAWTSMAKANVILDNLIAQGKAKPMIVVMPLGYGSMDMITRGWAAWRDPVLVALNFSSFSQALFEEVIPRIVKGYPASTRREDHAIAGLSMGGAESLLVGLNHPDDFAYVGGFSAGGLGQGQFEKEFPAITMDSGAKQQANLRLLWISCGSEDGLLGPNQSLIAWLKDRHMTPKAIVTPGMHVWPVWRDNLANFLPLLFQPN